MKSLAAFRKTSLLDPGQQAEVTLQFDIRTLSVYDEARAAFVLPQGEYGLLLGSSAANTEACAVLTVEKEAVVEEAPLITPAARSFPVMSPKQASIAYDPTLPRFSVEIPPLVKVPTAAAGDTKIQAQLERLTDAEKISLVVGGGYKINCYNSLMGAAGRTSTELLKKGIPNIVLSDGPRAECGPLHSCCIGRQSPLPGRTSRGVEMGLAEEIRNPCQASARQASQGIPLYDCLAQ